MNIEAKHWTMEAFWEFTHLPENANKHFELWEGALIEMAGPKPAHNYIAGRVYFFIMLYLETNPHGWALGDRTDYALTEDIVFQPDVSFISYTRYPALPEHYFEGAPDIAVEVVSPSNSTADMTRKAELYIKHGTQIVWVIEDDPPTVWEYRPTDDNALLLRKFTITDFLNAAPVLPDSKIAVAELFPKRKVAP